MFRRDGQCPLGGRSRHEHSARGAAVLPQRTEDSLAKVVEVNEHATGQNQFVFALRHLYNDFADLLREPRRVVGDDRGGMSVVGFGKFHEASGDVAACCQ